MIVILIMPTTNLADLDLNLLRVLDALLLEQHLTRAAHRIGLSQPAMSHALARLRQHLGDPLFIRTPKGLLPTARATRLAGPVRSALATLEAALAGTDEFDAARAQRSFVLATADYGSFVLVPPLLSHLGRAAPGVDLWVRPVADDAYAQLAQGDADALVMPLPSRRPVRSIHSRLLFEERFVCLVREGHPRVKKRLDLRTYTSLPHVFVAPRGTPGGVVDTVLGNLGKSRRVAVGVPQFLLAPHLVASSDFVVTIGSRVAEAFARLLPLRVLEPPVELPRFKMQLAWHERQHHDPAQRWLRAQLVELVDRGAVR
jgi:DNA-binding transcriptional LysR family regulator